MVVRLIIYDNYQQGKLKEATHFLRHELKHTDTKDTPYIEACLIHLAEVYIKMDNINNNFYMLKNLKNHNKQFIFLSLKNTIYTHKIDLKTNKIIICPDENMYNPKHEYYEIAKLFVQQPILDYISVIEEASEIHVIDNLFYYLALKCNLNSDNNTCYSTEYNGKSKRPVFMDKRFKYEIINEPYFDLDLIRKQTLMHMRDRKN